MEPLIDRLRRLFEGLPAGQAHLERLPNDHVSGHVISSAFEGMDYEQRRRMLHDRLDQAVTDGDIRHDELVNVSTLLTYTPEEWAVDLKEC